MTPAQRDQLLATGWRHEITPFWEEDPCFYDLSTIKTVLLSRNADGHPDVHDYFWKYDVQKRPPFIDDADAQVRRYKLHHSMNALLWYDHGDRKIVH